MWPLCSSTCRECDAATLNKSGDLSASTDNKYSGFTVFKSASETQSVLGLFTEPTQMHMNILELQVRSLILVQFPKFEMSNSSD